MTKTQNITINVFNIGKNMFYMPPSNNNDDRDSDDDSDGYIDDSSDDNDDDDDDDDPGKWMDDDHDDFYSPRYCSIENLLSKYNDDDDDDSEEEENDNIERFKKIDGYDNYSVSTFDRVRNDTNNQILKPGGDGRGYYIVCLHKNKKRKTHKVHRLVGLAFIPNRDDKPIVDHIDGYPSNNHLKNLRWASYEESA